MLRIEINLKMIPDKIKLIERTPTYLKINIIRMNVALNPQINNIVVCELKLKLNHKYKYQLYYRLT